jgi:hypothetical protein
MGPPNMGEERFPNRYTKVLRNQETKNLRKTVLTSKVVNPFTCALEPPFIGRRRDFYISRLHSNLRNIPNVNMYMNIFYIPWFAELISYIYKPATRSHLEPRLLALLLWLGPFTIFALPWRRFTGRQLPALHRWDFHRSRTSPNSQRSSTSQPQWSFPVPTEIFEVSIAKVSWIGNDLRNFHRRETRERPSNLWSCGDCFAHGQRVSEFFNNHESETFIWIFLACLHEFFRDSTPPEFRGWKFFTQFPNKN